jgi:hypothetical protein
MGGMVRRERVRLGSLEVRSKPAPFETQVCGTRSEGLGERIRFEQDALATRGGEIFSGNSAYGRVEAKVQVLWLLCGGGCRYGYYFYVCA